MSDGLYTVGQVAKRLDLHPKTVRQFIRLGKLKAHKMGGQWRVTEPDLRGFMAGDAENPDPAPLRSSHVEDFRGFHAEPDPASQNNVQVSAVIDVTVNSHMDAERLSNLLLAVMNTRDDDLLDARLDYLYYREEKRARFMIWGQPEFARKIIEVVAQISR